MAWLQANAFYGVEDSEKFARAVALLKESLIPELRDNGFYIGDNLITFGKTVGLLADEAFIAAVNAEKPNSPQLGHLWRTHVLCWAARNCLSVEGDFVEAGCYEGYTAKVIFNCVGFGDLARTYWLYDLFGENPDRERQLAAAGASAFQKTTARFSGAQNVRIVPGAIPESFALGPVDIRNGEGDSPRTRNLIQDWKTEGSGLGSQSVERRTMAADCAAVSWQGRRSWPTWRR